MSVIQDGHVPPLVFENVTSADSSSVAVRVMLSASSSVTVPASAAPAPSLLRYGASLTAVTVITNESVAVRAPSLTVQLIEYVLSLSLSAPVSAAAVGVPPRVACPPVSAVSDMNAGMSPPCS